MSNERSTKTPKFPKAPIDRIVGPANQFLHVASASGIILLLVTIAALVLANSSAADAFLAFWKTPIGFSAGSFEVQHSLKHWINDGLMAIFFFVVGLEVKRELVLGELRGVRQAALPLAAALGGMVVPAAIYLCASMEQAGRARMGNTHGNRHRVCRGLSGYSRLARAKELAHLVALFGNH